MHRMRRWRSLLALGLIAGTLGLAGCEADEAPMDELFPGQVADYLRTSGPAYDPETGVDQAVYTGPQGTALLRIRRVGADQIDAALSELPPTATAIGYDPALGERDGVFFTFADEYHAAWGNGDWVFVLSAPTEASRLAFLSGYGF